MKTGRSLREPFSLPDFVAAATLKAVFGNPKERTLTLQRHWGGVAAYCKPQNKVSLGLVEGLNNKIRVIQRSAYGYRDEDCLRLKIIASFLPPLPENAKLHPH